MSYYFRDKPRFGSRIQENTGDDLMETLKRQFDQDSKTFFEPTSTRSAREPAEAPFDHRHTGFSRGFPFNDDGFERRGNIRSHLDDLAALHPEFADHLLGSAWGDAPFLSTPRNRRRGSGLGNFQGHPDDDARSQASGSSAASAASGASGVSSHGEPESYSANQEPHNITVNQEQRQPQDTRKIPIPQYGLRNTVDIGQHRHNMDKLDKLNRGQRSASAPPENRQTTQPQQQQQEQYLQQQYQQPQGPNQRFVSRVDITPQQQQQEQAEAAKPPTSPKQQQPQQTQPQPQPQQQKTQQKPQQQGNVRHIPIFVEGRDEPVVPRNVDEPAFHQQQQRPQSPPQFQQTPPQFHRPSHFNQHFANNRQQQWPPQYHQQQQYYQQPQDKHMPQQSHNANHYQQQQQQYRQQQAEKQRAQQHQQEQQQQEAEPPKPKQTQPKDPLERVALVQQEVDSLMEQVKLYSGNSRQEKEYMYLDEMLTRELIKLDDIETEGKPNVRQARKDAIRSIQDCISLLESKVPLPGQETTNEANQVEHVATPTEMDVASTVESQADPVIQAPLQNAPIPLPPAPSAVQTLSTEGPVPVQEPVSDETMPTEVSPLTKVDSVTAMESQQDGEIPKTEVEDSPTNVTENTSDQQMDVDTAKTTKSLRKQRKTKPPKPVSEEPIPLPAPEVSHT